MPGGLSVILPGANILFQGMLLPKILCLTLPTDGDISLVITLERSLGWKEVLVTYRVPHNLLNFILAFQPSGLSRMKI
jgi:hypothetical protein